MSIRVALNHRTVYRYDRAVSLGPQVVRLRPAPHCRTPILSYSLTVRPPEHFINWQQDPHGNYLARLVFHEKATEFSVEVDLIAEMTVINPFDFFMDGYATDFPFEYETSLAAELKPFLEVKAVGDRFDAFMEDIDRTPQNTVDFLVALNQKVHAAVEYLVRMEPGVQTPEETLTKGSGSCRDSGWLLVQVLRRLGLAARFVSGYLVQLTSDEKPLEGPSGPASDFTDLHAWAEVYIPGAGWIGLDPTSGLLAGEGHIPLASTPDPSSAAPIAGSVEPSGVEFDFSMRVTRIHEDPRVTKPYTDEEWTSIDALGHRVDVRLAEDDVRLTMGGEPTFVSVDNMDGPEWNVTAVGPEKYQLSRALLGRIRDRFGRGGLLHFGQGKWYPGESLPRWAMACFWRKDGKPIWRDASLIADGERDYGFGPKEARGFAGHLAQVLGVEAKWVVPAYEDIAYYLWKEGRLPVNVDPADPKLANPEDRARMMEVFERGLSQPAGFVMPLMHQWWQANSAWLSGRWPVRADRLFLLPGDSPVGLRLPLESLPYAAPASRPIFAPLDPFAPRGPLPEPETIAQKFVRGEPEAVSMQGISKQSAPSHAEGRGESGFIPTALCVEPRQGRLHVFMPPVEVVESYLELVTAVEATAKSLKMPVIVEGYLPPQDPRLNQIKVTPDPGVIEVNVHPASNWTELKEITTGLYEDARQTRLGTEKFDLDGMHTGTGGGNHVVLGGATPQDSPFLRRPDLLKSFVGYWNNHPSLSYLFSGKFIGPTSQAPRVDEGRRDSIYEMAIAFAQVPEPGGQIPYWLVDRIFRNLLVDLTGNTHRAEFCIDKLYSADSSSGRLGLVEFRGFEMPPHARMSLAQQLLIRALTAWFWRTPYAGKLAEWGTQLHDRFLLPHFVWNDFMDVLDDLRRGGFEFAPKWFAPHFEFRFPAIGTVTHGGVTVELRAAIEPWYVLGEEPGGGGTVRYVDSSVERLQVRATQLTGERHVIACNGRRVPLHASGAQGEFVGGVRYRAWQPPNCLHPTIPVHAPLTFDVIDTWAGRSIGGCVYHVSHPGGRHYEAFPVNANEAEARRAARFDDIGHTPGAVEAPGVEANPDFPLTLDLRRG